MLNAIRDGIIAINTDDRVHTYNRAFAQMWDLPPFDEANPQTYNDIKAHLNAFLEKNLVERHDTLLDKDCSPNYTLTIVINEDCVYEQRNIHDGSNDRGISHIWSFHDASAAHRIRSVSQKRLNYLNHVLNHSLIAIFATNREGIFEFSRGGLLDSYGLDQGEVEGKDINVLYAGHPILADIRKVLVGRKIRRVHSFMRGDDIAYSDIMLSPRYNDLNEIVGIIGVAFDVTERRVVQDKLDEQQQLLETVLTHAPLILLATDLSGTVIMSRGRDLAVFELMQNEIVLTAS